MGVKDVKHITLSKAWATLKRIDFKYQFKNGEWKPMSRETYNRGDGVAILLYHPVRQTVILTRQFRMPIYSVNPEEALSLEVCAGAIDNGDSPLETILREVEEETGYRLKSAQHIMEAYTSPGALTEKIHLYVAEYHDELKIHEGGGLAHENEEIEVIELPFSEALQLVEKSVIRDAKTIILLQQATLQNLISANG